MCILSYVIREYYDQPAGSSVDNSDFFLYVSIENSILQHANIPMSLHRTGC